MSELWYITAKDAAGNELYTGEISTVSNIEMPCAVEALLAACDRLQATDIDPQQVHFWQMQRR